MSDKLFPKKNNKEKVICVIYKDLSPAKATCAGRRSESITLQWITRNDADN